MEGTQNQLQASLNYERLFAEKHNLKVLFLYEQSAKEEDNLWAKRNFEMDAVDELFAGSEEKQIGNADAGQIYRVTNMGIVDVSIMIINLNTWQKLAFVMTVLPSLLRGIVGDFSRRRLLDIEFLRKNLLKNLNDYPLSRLEVRQLMVLWVRWFTSYILF